MTTLSSISYERNEITIFLPKKDEIIGFEQLVKDNVLKEFNNCLEDWFNGGGHIRILKELDIAHPDLKKCDHIYVQGTYEFDDKTITGQTACTECGAIKP